MESGIQDLAFGAPSDAGRVICIIIRSIDMRLRCV